MTRQALLPEVSALWEAPLDPDAFERAVRAQLADEASMAEAVELISWFLRRYPSADARLAYARRKYAEWTRASTTRQVAGAGE